MPPPAAAALSTTVDQQQGSAMSAGAAASCGTTAPSQSEVLADAARRIEAETPWYETLGLKCEEAADGGSDLTVETVLAFNVVSGLIDAANETVLASVFVVLKGLLGAVQGAATARADIVELIRYCVGISRCLLDAAKAGGMPKSILSTVGEFEGEMEGVGRFVQTFGTRSSGCCRRMVLNSHDRDTAARHKQKLEDLLDAVMSGLAAQNNLGITEIKGVVKARDPPSLAMAEVPSEAPVLPRTYVQRTATLEKVVADLTDPQRSASSTHCLLGVGGGGKTLIASSVVRDDRIRTSFKHGIFWVPVGREGNNVALLLEHLAVEVSRVPTDKPRRCPDRFSGANEAVRHLSAVRAENDLRCLVVLDNVWDVEVMNALGLTGFHVLVTTRQREVIPPVHSGMSTEVGDMSEEDALEVLSKASEAAGPLPIEETRQVAHDCGMLPLALGVVGTLAKGQPLDPVSWRAVHKKLREERSMFRDMENGKLFSTIDASVCDLPSNQREQLQLMAVMASGVVATPEMLANLWNQDTSNVSTGGGALVNRCLLQRMPEGYRLHDLVLEYLKLTLAMSGGRVAGEASARQAQYLGRLGVFKQYNARGHNIRTGGLSSLIALWNSAMKLDGNVNVEACYSKSLEGVDEIAITRNVGFLLLLLGSYSGAEAILRKVLQGTDENGNELAEVGFALDTLADALRRQGKLDEADPLLVRAIEIKERALGPDHPSLATSLGTRATVLEAQGKYDEADRLYVRCIEIRERALGPDHPELAVSLNNRAELLQEQGKHDEADRLYVRCIEVEERALGPDHLEVAVTLNNRAVLLQEQGKLDEADPLLVRAIEIKERALGPDHPSLATSFGTRATVLQTQGKYDEADWLYVRCIEVEERALGPDHPELAVSLNNRAVLLQAQQKLEEAESLVRRALGIVENHPGSDLSRIACFLHTLAEVKNAQGQHQEADPLYLRAIDIFERTVGRDHPLLAETLHNRARSLKAQGKVNEARPIFSRALVIRNEKLGEGHEDTLLTQTVLNELDEGDHEHGPDSPPGELHSRRLSDTAGPTSPSGFGSSCPDPPPSPMKLDIEELLALETKLNTQCESATSSVRLDAEVNILRYLQVQTVLKYEAAYDALYYELNKDGGLACLHKIAPVRSTDLVQPKVLELQDCNEDDRLENQLNFYLSDAKLAKQCLDEAVVKIARDSGRYEVHRVDVKSRESTRRKASKFCNGNVREIADMARVTVICVTPEALEQAHVSLMKCFQPHEVLRVKNGFISDWMPGGYRDVKVNPVVNQHLCEIQLQLRDFYDLKSGQHAVYTWARDLKVTADLNAEDLLENISPEVMAEMARLARQNWHGSGSHLPMIQLAAGHSDLAEQGLRQELSEAEDMHRGLADHESTETREAILRISKARARLAVVLQKKGKYDDASLLLELSLVSMKKLGPEHPEVAAVLNNLASILESQGKFAEAEPLYRRATEICETALGPEHPKLATALNNRAGLLMSQGKYAEAGPLFERCQAIQEKVLGPEHRNVASSLNNRAQLLEKQGKYDEAEPLYLRAIAIGEKTLGLEHADLAVWLNNRAVFLDAQGKCGEAEPLYARATEIWEKALGPEHPSVAAALINWAGLLERQGEYAEAEPLYAWAIEILEKAVGPRHPAVATALNNRAGLLENQGKYSEAEPLYERCQAIEEEVLGPEHPSLATTLNNRALLLQAQGKYDQADCLNLQAIEILERALGPDHHQVASVLSNRAGLLDSQGKYDEAEPLYDRATAIGEKALGPEHPKLAEWLNNRAMLLMHQGKYAEAEPLFERCQAIQEKVLGLDHQKLAITLHNRAVLLEAQEKYREAIPIVERALKIRTKNLGENHPDTVGERYNLQVLRQKV
eukprot:g6096.t1